MFQRFVNCALAGISLLMLFISCIEKEDTEIEKPSIEILSPSPCDTIYFGQPFHYTAQLKDNTGLGNISMDVHHNFGHHSHGNHESCIMDLPKDAVNPYSDSWIFSLPMDETEHTFDTLITFEAANENTTLYDDGDYHFHIYLTDDEGYQVFTTMDVKVLHAGIR